MPQPNDRQTRIEAALNAAFEPVSLSVTDDSHKHAGHAGAAPGGETHYSVEIVAEAFAGLSRVQVQRAVMMVLQQEFDTGLHALALKARAPEAS
ncbi:MAG: BolA family transcriptional regulator [Hyphomonas sp.]|uniref:BolA family protein n=1 Tax=Hyphomonas sp. TaxID=87 RepID=UPI001D3CEA05|nr:BolA family protein [Hyphomonas sp.]MBA4225382.1 BolA family transcriptional regulator [Hyphomonas sp.]